MELGVQIKEYLEQRGIKQSWLAGMTGIDTVTLNCILNGNRRILAEEYFKICHALGLPLETFQRRK